MESSGRGSCLGEFSLVRVSASGRIRSDSSITAIVILESCLLDDRRPESEAGVTRFVISCILFFHFTCYHLSFSHNEPSVHKHVTAAGSCSCACLLCQHCCFRMMDRHVTGAPADLPNMITVHYDQSITQDKASKPTAQCF